MEVKPNKVTNDHLRPRRVEPKQPQTSGFFKDSTKKKRIEEEEGD